MRIGFFIGRGITNSPRSEYLFVMFLSWVFFISWVVLLTAIHFVWNLSILWRILLTALLVIVTPSLQDLFLTFDDYLKETDRRNGDSTPSTV